MSTIQASQPCDLCGCKEVNLHDGFYYCAECGTQDTNFQETVVELIEVHGEILHGRRKKMAKIVEEKRQMSDAWYKWHAFNFLLKGTADELMEHGAEPSFKTKLLWVWTRYIKKYLKNYDIGLNSNQQNTAPNQGKEIDSDSDVDEPPADLLNMWDEYRDKVIKDYSFSLLVTLIYIALNLDRSPITLTHLIKLFKDGLLSVPYNINKLIPKEMRPEKLTTKIKKGLAVFKVGRIRLIAMTLFKRLDLGNPVVPDLRLIVDNYLKELCLPTDLKPLVLSLMQYKPCSFLDVNSKDNVVYKVPSYEFHIMTYILWALKLCLGLDCHYEVKLSSAAETINKFENRPKSYFVNGKSEPTNRMFSFREWVTFYEFRQILLRHYCYRYANKCSWDTDDYIALDHHMDLLEGVWNKNLKEEMTFDMINRIQGGNVETDIIPRSEFEPTLTPFHSYTQVIAQHLQDPELKMQLSEDFSQYSLKYALEDWHLVHPQSKTNRNLIKGIKCSNKIVTKEFATHVMLNKHCQKMVYVRDCENHNWLTTKPPTLAHVVKVHNLENDDDDDTNDENSTQQNESINNQTGLDTPKSITETSLEKSKNIISDVEMNENVIQNSLDSKSHSISENSAASIPISDRILFEEDILKYQKLSATENDMLRKWSGSNASNLKFPDIVSDCSLTNSTLTNSIQQIDDSNDLKPGKLDKIDKLREMSKKMANPDEITEEAEGVNIFDDNFKTEIKDELSNDFAMDCDDMLNVSDNFQDVPRSNQEVNRGGDSGSEVSSLDSVNFNENTFDRAKTIREIILHTCKKHNLPVPPEYKPKPQFKKEMGIFSRNVDCLANRICKGTKRDWTFEKKNKFAWKNYVTEYYNTMEEDILNQVAQKVNLAIQNAETQANEELEIDEPLQTTAMDNEVITNPMDVNLNVSDDENADARSRGNSESDSERLFSEDSEGETYAKELLPEKNPDYDEEVYDASQLYVKAAKTTAEGEMELDPELSSIINKKMVKDSRDPTLLNWTEERKKLERPDSEDEIPLSILQEFTELRKKLRKQKDAKLEPFVKKKVENFQYWLRFYGYHGYRVIGRTFEKKVCEELPTSFSFVLRQCALILGVAEGDLYRNLQHFEMTVAEKTGFELEKKKGLKFYDFD